MGGSVHENGQQMFITSGGKYFRLCSIFLAWSAQLRRKAAAIRSGTPFCQHAAVTDIRDQRPAEATLDFLRSAFPPEWREPALGHEAVADWEQENRVVLPEPYRAFIAEISNGSSLGPAGDGGLQPLGWLPDTWPDLGLRQPGEPFPLRAAWPWEDDESVGPEDPRIDAAFNNGSIVLGCEDGQSFWLLLTTGPRRGEVWMIADVGAVPAPDDQAWGFEEWVQRWHTGNDWWD